MENQVKFICLTPVKNESWILDDFLSAASLWADHIIVADQMSDDGSVEIAKKHEKVIFVENNCPDFNEPERQKLLINEARKIKGRKIFIALDADEFICADSIVNGDLDRLRKLDEGTVINFTWPFVSTDYSYYWNGDKKEMPFGFVDDGSVHIGKQIHSTRIPTPDNGKQHFNSNIPIMHFQFTDWKRMQSKHYWYQCFERKNFPKKSLVSIFRLYSHMYRVKDENKYIIDENWFQLYSEKGIELRKNRSQSEYYWDKLTQKMVSDNPLMFTNIDLPQNNTILLSYLRFTKTMNNIFIKVLDKLIGFFI